MHVGLKFDAGAMQDAQTEMKEAKEPAGTCSMTVLQKQ